MADVILTYKIVAFLFVCLFTAKANGETYGIMLAQSPPNREEQFCILFYKEFSKLPSKKTGIIFVPLLDESSMNFCSPNESYPVDLRDKFVLIDQSKCSVNQKAAQAKSLGCKGIIIVTNRSMEGYIEFNASAVDEGMNLTVALITEDSVKRLSEMGPGVTVMLYSPNDYGFDFTFVIIFAIAVYTVAIGAFWSGHVKHTLHNLEVSKLSEADNAAVAGGDQKSDSNSPVEESTLNISPLYIAVIVLCMISMLLLLYFFFSYLVYLIIGLFVLASIIAVFSCLDLLFFYIEYLLGHLQPRCPVNCSKHTVCWLRVRRILALSIAITLAVIWVVYRNESFSWILQDILGVAFIINMLKSVRLPSFKICTYLLVLLFFYDIFFVFITPYLTKKGDSVMVEVATGGNSKEQTGKATLFGNADSSPNEQLPMVLRVPHLRLDPWTICYQEYSMLGFGDILVPGLVVSYCHGIDLYLNKRKVYYTTTLISYGVGLMVTFGGLYLMNMPQPALLYLVPATLLPPIILAKYRKELSLLWSGIKIVKPEPEPGANGIPSQEIEGAESSPLPRTSNPIEEEGEIKTNQSLVSEGTGEKKFLLQNEAIK